MLTPRCAPSRHNQHLNQSQKYDGLKHQPLGMAITEHMHPTVSSFEITLALNFPPISSLRVSSIIPTVLPCSHSWYCIDALHADMLPPRKSVSVVSSLVESCANRTLPVSGYPMDWWKFPNLVPWKRHWSKICSLALPCWQITSFNSEWETYSRQTLSLCT